MSGFQFDFQNAFQEQKGQGEKPAALSDILSGLVSQFGIGRKREDELEEFWEEIAGETAPYSTVGGVRRGVLEILVSDAIFMQELLFQKEELLQRFRERFPEDRFEDLRFRVGAVGKKIGRGNGESER